jgi:hypothetical protein
MSSCSSVAANESRYRCNRQAGLKETLSLHPCPVRSLAHYRLSWAERLARNVRAPTAGRVTIRLFGIPAAFASFLGLATT